MHRGKLCASVSVLLAFASALSGCVSKAGWQYQPGPAQLASSRLPVSLAVAKFDDQRGSENSTYFFLCIFPLVPYCTAKYDRLENANGFLSAGAYNFRPADDLAEASAAELRQAGLFRDVFVTNRTVDPGTPLILRGKVLNTDWDGTRYSYLLGPYSGLLYLFGLPFGTADDTLKLRLDLVETSNGQVIWTDEISQNYSKTEGIYYDYGSDFGYPQMFRDGIKPAIVSLESFVASQPVSYWSSLPTAPAQAGAQGSQ